MDIDSLSIEYFSNSHYQNKKQHNNEKTCKVSQEDKEFYKKRIINEIKDMLKTNKSSYENEHLYEYFDNFIFQLVEHFKFIDKKDIIQSEYDNIQDDNIQNINIQSDSSFNMINNDINLIAKKQETKVLTIDNFVTKKMNKPKNKQTLPQKIDVNLKDPALKKKGIKKKKKDKNKEEKINK